jgi:hypothetical protein
MASTKFDRKLVHVIIALAIGSIAGGAPVNAASARSTDTRLLVAENAAPTGAASTMTPTEHRYWRHRGGQHPHFGSRRVRVPQSGPSSSGDR